MNETSTLEPDGYKSQETLDSDLSTSEAQEYNNAAEMLLAEREAIVASEESMLRDEFAMAALTGLCANPHGYCGNWEVVAKDAYNAADAIMAERSNYE